MDTEVYPSIPKHTETETHRGGFEALRSTTRRIRSLLMATLAAFTMASCAGAPIELNEAPTEQVDDVQLLKNRWDFVKRLLEIFFAKYERYKKGGNFDMETLEQAEGYLNPFMNKFSKLKAEGKITEDDLEDFAEYVVMFGQKRELLLKALADQEQATQEETP
ncbi:MAG: hypothetical protein ABH856_03955 [Patescibacteria group bacterium]